MSKLSFLPAVLAAFAITSAALAQQPAPQRLPLFFAQTPEGTVAQPVAPNGAPFPGSPMPQSVLPDAPRIYAPEGEMSNLLDGQRISMFPEQGDAPEGYGPPQAVDQVLMGGDGYGIDEGDRHMRRRLWSRHGDDPDCPCQHGGSCRNDVDCCQPRWYMRTEAVWLKRADGPARNLVVYDADGADPLEDLIVLGTNDLDLGTALGLRWTLGRFVSERTSIEGGFYGLHDWHDRRRTWRDDANQPFNPYWGDDNESSFDVSAFSNSAQYLLSYDTDFDSAELGLRRWWGTDTSLLMGVRYMGWDEKLSLLSRDQGTIDPTALGVYEVRTENDMFGVQMGAGFDRQLWVPWLGFNFEAKAGAFVNSARHKSSLAVTTPTSAIDAKSESSVAFATNAEFSIGLSVQVTEHFILRGGYTANMLKNGIAIAPDQLDTMPHRFNSREYVNDDGTAILYGAYFGGEWIWD